MTPDRFVTEVEEFILPPRERAEEATWAIVREFCSRALYYLWLTATHAAIDRGNFLFEPR
jgi:hypothetical protein